MSAKIRVLEFFLTITGMTAVASLASQLLPFPFGLIIGLAFCVLVNYVSHKRRVATNFMAVNAISANNTIRLPGKFTLMLDSAMAVDLNGRQMILDKNEGVEIKVPESCGLVSMKFVNKLGETNQDSDDDILSSKYIV